MRKKEARQVSVAKFDEHLMGRALKNIDTDSKMMTNRTPLINGSLFGGNFGDSCRGKTTAGSSPG